VREWRSISEGRAYPAPWAPGRRIRPGAVTSSSVHAGRFAITMPMTRTHVALLRGINVGGRHKVPMADLRALASELGFDDPRTCIQSGNLVFEATDSASRAAAALEAALAERFGFEVPTVAMEASALAKARRACPFAEAARERPSQVHAGFAPRAFPRTIARGIEERGAAGELAKVAGGALWIDFPAGVGRSKITPAVLDRLAGAPVTMRNAKTLDRILELCSAG